MCATFSSRHSNPSIRTENGKIVLSVADASTGLGVEIVDAATGTRDTVVTAGMMAAMSTLVADEIARLSAGVESSLSQQSSTMADAADLIQDLRTRLNGVDSELDSCESTSHLAVAERKKKTGRGSDFEY